VGPPGINVHDWEVCHRESGIKVSSGCPDTFDQIVYHFKGFFHSESTVIV
jgi:hypothetical protein